MIPLSAQAVPTPLGAALFVLRQSATHGRGRRHNLATSINDVDWDRAVLTPAVLAALRTQLRAPLPQPRRRGFLVRTVICRLLIPSAEAAAPTR